MCWRATQTLYKKSPCFLQSSVVYYEPYKRLLCMEETSKLAHQLTRSACDLTSRVTTGPTQHLQECLNSYSLCSIYMPIAWQLVDPTQHLQECLNSYTLRSIYMPTASPSRDVTSYVPFDCILISLHGIRFKIINYLWRLQHSLVFILITTQFIERFKIVFNISLYYICKYYQVAREPLV